MTPKPGDKIKFKGDIGVVLDCYKNEKGPYYTLNFKGEKYSHAWTTLEKEDLEKVEVIK